MKIFGLKYLIIKNRGSVDYGELIGLSIFGFVMLILGFINIYIPIVIIGFFLGLGFLMAFRKH